MFLCLGLLSFRIFYINYFGTTKTSLTKNANTEVYGTKRGLIFDRNLKKIVETESRKIKSVSNPAFFVDVPKRYSSNQLCEHIIGYTDYDNKGISGIEKDYDKLLKGFKNEISVTTFRDANGSLLLGKGSEVNKSNQCTDNGIALSIDKDIQSAVELYGKALDKGAALVLDSQSGDILASASFPEFEPDKLEKYLNDENKALINRVFLNYNVGSVFKVVVCMAALESGINPDFSYKCTGKTFSNGIVFHCHKLDGHGKLNMKEALALSCNTYFIELAKKTGSKKIIEMCKKLNLDKREILSESLEIPPGTLPSVKNLSSEAALSNFSFGQGELSLSPIKTAGIYSCIANGGYLIKNRLVLGTVNNGRISTQNTKTNRHRVISQKNANIIMDFLKFTVENGTGKNAKSDFFETGGKTATAQTGKMIGKREVLISYFVGYISIKGDKFTVLVMKEDGSSGSGDCAPIFKKISEEIYRIKQ